MHDNETVSTYEWELGLYCILIFSHSLVFLLPSMVVVENVWINVAKTHIWSDENLEVVL